MVPVDRVRTAGFTLIEVLVVLAILGLSAALIVSRGPARSSGLDLRDSAGTIAQSLRLARSQAIATDRVVTFALGSAGRSYGPNGQASAPLPPEITLVMTTAIGGPARPQAAIIFAPDGSSSGGRLLVVAGARQLQIMVDWLTGRVSVTDAP